MLTTVRFTKEGTPLPKQDSSYMEIREFIDKHNLLDVEVVRLAYMLANENPPRELRFFLQAGVDQEDINLLYQAGGYYCLGEVDSKGTYPFTQLSVETTVGVFKNSEGIPMINYVTDLLFLLRVDAIREYTNEDGELCTVTEGCYVHRDLFSCSIQGEITQKQLNQCILCTNKTNMYVPNRNTPLSISTTVYSFVKKECPDLVKESEEYVQLTISGHHFLTFVHSLHQPFVDLWNREALDDWSVYAYLLVHKPTGTTLVYL